MHQLYNKKPHLLSSLVQYVTVQIVSAKLNMASILTKVCRIEVKWAAAHFKAFKLSLY